MADWYCDPSAVSSGAYSATPVAGGTTPTKPEDGNGKATGAATMATLVLQFVGIPTAGGTVTIAGVTFTAVASGATGNQFNAVTSASTCATNLAAAINASTTAVVNPTMAVSCPLRNAVNAVASGASVTVYTRVAGSEWNSVTESETLTSFSISTQWAGGGDGAWGYLFNPASIAWPSSVGAGTYGAFPGSYLGTPAAGDVIHIRTARSGANVTVTFPTSALTVTLRNIGTVTTPLYYLADNGVKWSGDAGVLTIGCDISQYANRAVYAPYVSNWKQVLSGVETAADTYNWRWELTGAPNPSGYSLNIGGNDGQDAMMEIACMEFTGASGAVMNDTNSGVIGLQITPFRGSQQPKDHPAMVVRKIKVRSASKVTPFAMTSGSYDTSYYLESCLFDHTGQTQASTHAMVSGQYGGRMECVNCRWTNFPATSNQSGIGSGNSAYAHTIILRNCSYTNIQVGGGSARGGLLGNGEPTGHRDMQHSLTVQSSLGSRFFLFENSRRMFGWIESAAPKVSTSVLPDGTTAFSIRCAVTSTAGQVTVGRPAVFPPLGKINSLANGTRTATLRLLVDNNFATALGHAPRNDEMWIDVFYGDTSGAQKAVSSRVAIGSSPTALAAGVSGDWSATSYDVYGSTHNYTAYKIEVSLPDVPQYAELSLRFSMGCQTSSIDDLVFLDPEWSLV